MGFFLQDGGRCKFINKNTKLGRGFYLWRLEMFFLSAGASCERQAEEGSATTFISQLRLVRVNRGH